MSRIKVLLVSPCQGGYGGIEAFVLAVAAAVRREARHGGAELPQAGAEF